VLAVVPVEGCTDDETTAQASIDIQLSYLMPKGRRAGVIIVGQAGSGNGLGYG
jgi:hypothetical protein